MFTRADVINQAFRRLGIGAEDEAVTGDAFAFASRALDGIAAEIENETGEAVEVDTVAAQSFLPMANLLAVEIAPAYEVAPRDSRGRAWARLLATLRSDDREDVPTEAQYF